MCRWAVAAALAAASACGEATGPSGGVKIVAATGTLAQLDTLQLSVAGDGRVTWTTSDPAVATVSPAGLVTAAYFGHATIYASRGGQRDSVAIWVPYIGNPMVVAARGPRPQFVAVGDTLTYLLASTDLRTAEPLTGLRLTWSVSDSTVVRFIGGNRLVAAKAGHAQIVARTGNLKGTWDIDVLAQAPPATAFVAIDRLPVDTLFQRSISLSGALHGTGLLRSPSLIPVPTFELYVDGNFRWRRTATDTATDVYIGFSAQDTVAPWQIVLRDTLSAERHSAVVRVYNMDGVSTQDSVSFVLATRAVSYQLQPLAMPAGVASSASDVNDRGDVAGWTDEPDGTSHPVLWRNGVPTTLASNAARSTRAIALSESDDMIGLASVSLCPGQEAIVWPAGSGSTTSLGMNCTDKYRVAINRNGVALAGSVRYTRGAIDTVPISYAASINDAGQIVGSNLTSGEHGSLAGTVAAGVGIAFQFPAGYPNPRLQFDSRAAFVNSRGDVVGVSHGEWWFTPAGGAPADITPALGGVSQLAVPVDLDDAGNVLAFDSQAHTAYLWNRGVVSRIDVLPSGWRLESVSAINRAGVIAGQATNLATGEKRAILLSPR